MTRFSAKKIDGLGRITLPLELRYALGWKEKDVISIHQVDANTVILQRNNNLSDLKELAEAETDATS